MGREVKRVALDFSWPLHKVWEGYVNNLGGSSTCAACNGTGSSPQAQWLHDQWYGNAGFEPRATGSVPLTPETPAVKQFATKNTLQSIFVERHGFDRGIEIYWQKVKDGSIDEYIKTIPNASLEAMIRAEGQRLCAMWNGQWSHHLDANDVKALLRGGRLHDFTRRPLNEEQKAEYEAVEKWNAEERERAIKDNGKGKRHWKTFKNGHIPTPQEVNDWHILSFGHDAINQWVCVQAKCKRLGYPTQCSVCKGEGCTWDSPEAKSRHEDWKKTEPPKGDGYQIWETVSEGSPVSPVFATPEELARWMSTPGNDTSVTKGTDYEGWLKFIGVGWAPSMIGDANGIKDGVKAIAERA